MRKHISNLNFKYLHFFLFFNFILTSAQSQVVNFDQVIAPEGQTPKNFEDYLVQLAWVNSQENEINILEKNIAEREVIIQKRAWMDDVSFSFNLNEVSLENVLDTDKSDNIVINPLYQFTAGVRLSTFFVNPKEREITEIKVKLKDLEGKQKKLEIRKMALEAYQNFDLANKIKEVRGDSEQAALTNYNYASERFQSGDVGLEDLIRAQESHQRAIEQRLDSEAKAMIAKYNLEELIGIKWETAERYKERLKE